MRLEPVARLPGKRVLTWDGRSLYASERYRVVRSDTLSDPSEWKDVAEFRPRLSRRLASSNRFTARLLRSGFHVLRVLGSGRLVGIVDGAVVVAGPSDTEFRVTFTVLRGTRPLTLAVGRDDHLYWGEYFANPHRDEVHIYGSRDRGDTWDIVHTFPKDHVKHVHTVTWDPFAECFWVLTGDYEQECKILRADQDWSVVETVMSGDQQTRAATCLPSPDGLYFATDTPLAQNHIYLLDRSGRLEKGRPLAGSSLQSCRVDGGFFFSTAVEPSTFNRSGRCTVVGSADGVEWADLLEWRKDRLPAGLFQFGNIFLPTGNNETSLLAATGMAVRREDFVSHIWRVHS